MIEPNKLYRATGDGEAISYNRPGGLRVVALIKMRQPPILVCFETPYDMPKHECILTVYKWFLYQFMAFRVRICLYENL